MSALDWIWAEGALRTVEQLPSKLDNIGSIVKSNPIVSLGLVGGSLLGISGDILPAIALIGLGLWQWIGLRGIIAGLLGILILGGI